MLTLMGEASPITKVHQTQQGMSLFLELVLKTRGLEQAEEVAAWQQWAGIGETSPDQGPKDGVHHMEQRQGV